MIALLLVLPAVALVPTPAIQQFQAGRVAVVDNFLDAATVKALRDDAARLYAEGRFSQPNRDTGLKQKSALQNRAVLRERAWSDYALGDGALRQRVAGKIKAMRGQLAQALGRNIDVDGAARHEVSYTRFAPGASLRRHIDEHHEETKGVAGWAASTRRSVTWLVYLNDRWSEDQGGELRAYEREAPAGGAAVGATPDLDLQVGWLRATPGDPVDRPVFLDSRRPGGNCAFRCVLATGDAVVSRDFPAQPALYVNSDLAQRVLFTDAALGARYTRLEQLKTPLNPDPPVGEGYRARDVVPTAGKLVLYDSVTVPHEVLEVAGDVPRFALAGWFHEDQQPMHVPRKGAPVVTGYY
mmetsp:Transcript_16558/g.49440  ORF Transcript_16558/g.49440 Transcript_16558/m.49440 type:complete len:354 (+) Transcript_16558:141-1202(+)